jgi:hypothetical protein
LQRYRELLKQKQDEKCLPAFNKTFDEESVCPNENIPPTKYHNKNHTLNYQGNAEFAGKRSLVHGKHFSNLNTTRRPPQSQPAQPLRSSKNLQQLYRNSRKEAEEDKTIDASIDTLQLSSSSQCSVASLADEILNETFFDPKTAHLDDSDVTMRSERDEHTCGGLLSFLVDDSLYTITADEKNIDESSKVSISEINSQNLERSTSKKFESDDSHAARTKTPSNTDDLKRISGENVVLIQRQTKSCLSEEISSSPSALSSSKSGPMQGSTDIEGLDVSRVVSDDDEELTVVSDIREPESVANVSSVFSWNSVRGKDSKPFSPFTALRCNSVDIALDESKQYARKIQELTKALEKAQGDISLLKNQRQADKETIMQLSRQARSKEEEMLRLLHKGMGADNRKSPVAKQHTEFSISQLKAELQKEERRNESLLRRNETLIKESKFADQTCVELSCRNQALEVELERMSQELRAAREENEGLNGVIIRAAQYGSKLESDYEALTLEAAEQRTRLETQLEEARITVAALNSKNDAHVKQTEQINRDMALLELQLQDKERKIKLLESKLEQMRPCANIQVGVKETDDELTIETQHDQTNKIDKKYANHTPTKNDLKHYSFGVHTPTSHVLAKTLQFELMKGHHVNERVFESEKALTIVQSKYEDVLQELKLEKEKVFFLQENMARASSDVDVAKQALAAWIDPLLFLKHDLQKLLHNGNSSSDTDVKALELEAIDDLSKAKVVARNITQEVTNLAKRIFAERANIECELKYWKDLASSICEDEPKVFKNCRRVHGIGGLVDEENTESQDFETSYLSSTFSISSHSKPLRLSLNNADKEKHRNIEADLVKAQVELQQAKKQLYLTKQEYCLLSKKCEDSQKYLRLNLSEKEHLLRDKEELINQNQLLEEETRECHCRIIELEEVNTVLANDLTMAKADVDESLKMRDELHKKICFLESEREKNKSQMEGAKIAIDEKDQEIISLNECIHRANGDAKAAADKLTAVEKDADALRIHINNAEQKVAVLEAELLNMSSLKDIATNESILLKQRLEQLEASFCMKCEEYDTLQDELQHEKTAFQAKWDIMVQTRCAEETEMQETIVLIKAELMATKDEYDGIIDSLHKKIEESEQELSFLRVELIKANAKNEGVLRRLADAKGFNAERL